MARIAIIGGGWVGCHLASKLINDHQIKVFEKEKELFTKASYNNQNRLHAGYHYARNFKTRELCRTTFDSFMSEYGMFTNEVKRNYYCVSNYSNIDFQTYLQIFHGFDFEIVSSPLQNIEGCINTKERYIDFHSLNLYFNSKLNKIFIQKEIKSTDDLKKDYDFVIDCTNNFLNSRENSFYELTVTLLYKKKNLLPFDALTLVDGNFFSIYPYKTGMFTLTDVEYTPVKVFSSSKEAENYEITSEKIDQIRFKMEERVTQYYPNFKSDFEYVGFFKSIKCKFYNNSANRYPMVKHNGSVISCYTGKIQGIYPIESIVESYIK